MWRYTTDAGTHHLFETTARGDEPVTSECGTIEANGPFVQTDSDALDGVSQDNWCANCLNAIEDDEEEDE